MKEKEATRINKYLSEIGYCSRRAADKLIEEKRVFVNGLIPEMGTKVSDSDEIVVDGVRIQKTDIKPIYIAFNKPIGIVCTTDTGVEKDNIIDYINFPSRIFPIGRLDKNSHGLIFLTNDGDIVNKILRASNNHEKEYVVRVNRPVTSEFIHRISNGVPNEQIIPDDPDLLIADQALEDGDFQSSITAFEKVLARKPGDPEATQGLANAKLLLRTSLADATAAQAAVLANPEDAKAQALAADFEILSGQAEAALDRLIKFIATNQGAQRDIARTHLLELFQNFAPTEPILIAARSALSKALF